MSQDLREPAAVALIRMTLPEQCKSSSLVKGDLGMLECQFFANFNGTFPGFAFA